MSKYKKTPFAPWETTKENGIEERFIRMGNSMLLHTSVRELSHTAFRVYTYMKLESAGKPEFTFPKTKWKGYISPNGFQKAKEQLCLSGFIEEVQNNANLRKPNVYRFSSKWKNAN